MSRPRKSLRVAIAVPQGLAFLERMLLGVAEHARRCGGWTFTRLPDALGPSIAWLRHWSGDGAFALVTTPSDILLARRLPFPVVNLASHLNQSAIPTVTVDHAMIGASAARHLIERGFRRFAYFGSSSLWHSQLRYNSFRAAVDEAGGETRALEIEAKPGASQWRDQERRLLKWLSSLVTPVGILASTDLRASMVLDACRRLGLRVPEDVAVVGVDNDPVIAEFADPPLTSVSRNDLEVGRVAAELLARLMDGAGPPPGPLFVPPDGIVPRRSTETFAVDDPSVARAVLFIRKNIHRNFGVEELLREVPLSRRALEYHFRHEMGSTPYDFINKMRVEAAKRMLAGPASPKLAAIADACGFQDSRRFRLVFQRLTGMTPMAYRRAQVA